MKCLVLSLPQYVLVFFVFHSHVLIVAPLCHPEESSALLQFKSSFHVATTSHFYCGDTSYPKTFSWNKSVNCCEWDGITCDETTGHVIELDLSCSKLEGILSSNSSLFSLRHLESLILSYNDFRGSPVLQEFGQLKNLNQLQLSSANFSGNVPLEIAHLSKLNFFALLLYPEDEKISIGAATFKALALNLTDLEFLVLMNVDMSAVSVASMANLSSSLILIEMSFCKLNGELPENFFHFPELQNLRLTDNNLSGHIPWSFLNFEHLMIFDIKNNSFTGQIPELYGNSSQNSTVFHSSLMLFRLSSNLFKGIVPSWVFKQTSLVLLDLSNNYFTGLVKSSVFQNVKLKFLDLSSNNFSGNLELEKLSKLKELSYLSLSSNNLSWSLNSSIKSLSVKSLETLDLSSNSFSGPLPIFSSPFLSIFFASENQFSGAIPTSICNFTSLTLLDLSDNDLIGKIPQCMGSFSQNLSLLNLQSNKLHGMIPLTFPKRNSLRNLNLNGNQLEGPLPRSLVYCKSLEVLDLGNNLVNDTFPEWLESLPELRVLVLRANRFHGPIGTPKCKSPFPELRIIDLSNNSFSGSLPAKYFENLKAMMYAENFKMEYMGDGYYQDTVTVTIKGFSVELVAIQSILTTIDVSSNKFFGEIPELIGRLKSLKGLNLSHNMLNGTIPTPLGNLTNLEWLDLSSNELVGTIPSELVDIPWLGFLNFSRNHLEEPIPQGKQFNTFTNNSFAENSGLCGFPLSKTCGDHQNMINLEPSPPTLEQDDSSIADGFNWKIVLMGYASGFVIGVSIGYILLYSNGRLSWLCKKIEGEVQQKIWMRRITKKNRSKRTSHGSPRQ